MKKVILILFVMVLGFILYLSVKASIHTTFEEQKTPIVFTCKGKNDLNENIIFLPEFITIFCISDSSGIKESMETKIIGEYGSYLVAGIWRSILPSEKKSTGFIKLQKGKIPVLFEITCQRKPPNDSATYYSYEIGKKYYERIIKEEHRIFFRGKWFEENNQLSIYNIIDYYH